jgi:hypothetical protein
MIAVLCPFESKKVFFTKYFEALQPSIGMDLNPF